MTSTGAMDLTAQTWDGRPPWVRACSHPGCVLTSDHQHGTQREATADESAQWQRQYTAGYEHGRSDARFQPGPRDGALIDIPAEVPGETGAQYVARHLPVAWRVGYARAWEFYSAR